MVPVIVVAINATFFYGSTRIRVAAEPSIAALASAERCGLQKASGVSSA